MGDIVADAVAMADWFSRALFQSGYRADFSPASLVEIDRFFDEQSADGVPKPGGLLATDTGARLFAAGAYVGEVVRRGVGGEWRADSQDPDSELGLSLVLPDQSAVWPILRTMKRYDDGSENSIAAYGAALGIVVENGVEDTAMLISRSCTTGWLDWIHGELWLSATALIRSRLSLSQTLANGRGGVSPTIEKPTPAVSIPPHLLPEKVRAGHRTNRYLPLAEIATATLHRGRINDRLDVGMHSGARYKLLWLGVDPAFAVLREALRRTLDERLTLD